MSRVYTDTIEPRKPTQDITLGTTGETITLPGNDLRVNTVKDKGGNTLWTSDGSGNLSNVNAGLKGNLVLLTTQTASGVASVSFTSGLDSTYDVYIFKFIDIDAATLNAKLEFQGSTDGGSTYNTTMTTTFWMAYHNEADNSAGIAYIPAQDQAQGSAYQPIAPSFGSDADQCAAVELHLFAPSSTTYGNHFYITTSQCSKAPEQATYYVAGYFNTTSALDALSFKMDTGNFDGTIKMYGLL